MTAAARRRRSPWLLASLAWIGLLLLFFFPVVFQGKVLAPLDILEHLMRPWSDGAGGFGVHNAFVYDAISQYLPYDWAVFQSIRLLDRMGLGHHPPICHRRIRRPADASRRRHSRLGGSRWSGFLRVLLAARPLDLPPLGPRRVLLVPVDRLGHSSRPAQEPHRGLLVHSLHRPRLPRWKSPILPVRHAPRSRPVSGGRLDEPQNRRPALLPPTCCLLCDACGRIHPPCLRRASRHHSPVFGRMQRIVASRDPRQFEGSSLSRVHRLPRGLWNAADDGRRQGVWDGSFRPRPPIRRWIPVLVLCSFGELFLWSRTWITFSPRPADHSDLYEGHAWTDSFKHELSGCGFLYVLGNRDDFDFFQLNVQSGLGIPCLQGYETITPAHPPIPKPDDLPDLNRMARLGISHVLVHSEAESVEPLAAWTPILQHSDFILYRNPAFRSIFLARLADGTEVPLFAEDETPNSFRLTLPADTISLHLAMTNHPAWRYRIGDGSWTPLPPSSHGLLASEIRLPSSLHQATELYLRFR